MVAHIRECKAPAAFDARALAHASRRPRTGVQKITLMPRGIYAERKG